MGDFFRLLNSENHQDWTIIPIEAMSHPGKALITLQTIVVPAGHFFLSESLSMEDLKKEWSMEKMMSGDTELDIIIPRPTVADMSEEPGVFELAATHNALKFLLRHLLILSECSRPRFDKIIVMLPADRSNLDDTLSVVLDEISTHAQGNVSYSGEYRLSAFKAKTFRRVLYRAIRW